MKKTVLKLSEKAHFLLGKHSKIAVLLLSLYMSFGAGQINAQALGQIDTTFNYGRNYNFFINASNPNPGTGLGAALSVNGINEAILLSDGKLFIAGTFSKYNGKTCGRIAKLTSDGWNDLAFNPISGADGEVKAAAEITGGKIVIAGDFSNYSSTAQRRVAVINSDGSLDATFNVGTGSNGGANGTVQDVAVQTDGKIIIAGDFTRFNSSTNNRARIARLNADGSLDTSFDPALGADATIYCVAIQPDGKLLIAGSFANYNGVARKGIARLNADGTLDTTFDPVAGVGVQTIYALKLLSNGKLYIGGSFTTYNSATANRIARLNSDGTLDNTFNVSTGPNGDVLSILELANNKILIGGSFATFNGNANKRNGLVCLNDDGTMYNIFNVGDGMNVIGSGVGYSVKSLVGLNGKVLAVGEFKSYNSTAFYNIVCINVDGSSDPMFNPVPGFLNRVGVSYGVLDVRTIVTLSTGKILVGGRFDNYNGHKRNCIVRLNHDGSVDTSFVVNGFNNSQGTPTVNTLAVQSDGKIVVGGHFHTFNSTNAAYIIRLNANGTKDNTFQTTTGLNAEPLSIAIQSDGKILVAGRFGYHGTTAVGRLVRLNTDGTVDATFVTNTGTGANQEVGAVTVDANGKILIGGEFATFNGTASSRIARLNSNGTLDGTFTIGTGITGSGYVYVSSIAVQPDGNILVAGDFTRFNSGSNNCNGIIRLTSSGTMDASFTPGTGPNDYVSSMQLQSNGKIVIGGHFSSISGSAYKGIAQLNADGSLNTSFFMGTGFNATKVNALGLEVDGNIIAGGPFETYNSVYRSGIVRLIGDATGQHVNVFNHKNEKWFVCYPNPTTNDVTINWGSGKGKVSIIDVLGKIIYYSETEASVGVNLSEYPAGMYIVMVTSSAGTQTKKLIKQ